MRKMFLKDASRMIGWSVADLDSKLHPIEGSGASMTHQDVDKYLRVAGSPDYSRFPAIVPLTMFGERILYALTNVQINFDRDTGIMSGAVMMENPGPFAYGISQMEQFIVTDETTELYDLFGTAHEDRFEKEIWNVYGYGKQEYRGCTNQTLEELRKMMRIQFQAANNTLPALSPTEKLIGSLG